MCLISKTYTENKSDNKKGSRGYLTRALYITIMFGIAMGLVKVVLPLVVPFVVAMPTSFVVAMPPHHIP